MKRIFTIIVAAALVLPLVSCGSRNRNNSEDGDATEVAEDVDESEDIDDSGDPYEIAMVTMFLKSDPAYKTIWEFAYDDEFRLMGGVLHYEGPDTDPYEYVTAVQYGDEDITVIDDVDRVTVYSWQDGRIVGESTMDGGNDAVYTYCFDEGRVTSLEVDNIDAAASVAYSWKGNEIVKIERTYEEGSITEDYKYSDVVITTKVKVVDLIVSGELSAVSILPGCASPLYPTKIVRTTTYEGEVEKDVETMKFVYHTDEATGLVTGIEYTNNYGEYLVQIAYCQ